MKSRPAVQAELSSSLRVVVAFTPSGTPDSLTLVRGRESFVASGVEVSRLRDALGSRNVTCPDGCVLKDNEECPHGYELRVLK